MPFHKDHRVLVTGACGFVGRFLTRYFLENSAAQIMACCRSANALSLKSKRLMVLEADLLQSNSFRKIFEKYKPTHIVHLAAIARLKEGEVNPIRTVETNLVGTQLLVNLAVEHGVEALLNFSSNLARNPKSVTGISKYLAETYINGVNSKKTRLMSLRLPNIPDGPGTVTLIFKRQIENDQSITITHQDMSRVFVSLEETAAFVECIFTTGKTKDLFVVTKAPEKITDLAKDMIHKSGKPIDIQYIGIQSGEKLQEESYPEKLTQACGIAGLSRMISPAYPEKEIKELRNQLNSRIRENGNNSELQTINHLTNLLMTHP